MSKDFEKGNYTTPDGVATWERTSTACCALLIFCSGCLIAWVAPTLSILMKPDSPIPTTPEDAATMAAIGSIGLILAPIIAILTVDRIGRKNTLMIGTLPLIINWGMIIIAKDVTIIYVARLFGGVSMGVMLCTVPMYLGEIASVKVRGLLGMICNTMINTGIIFMFVVVPHVSVQMMASICLSIIVIAAVITWFIPESPYFLAMKGRFEEAEINLEKLRGKTDVTEELNLIKETLRQNDKSTRYEYREKSKQGKEEEEEEEEEEHAEEQTATSHLKLLFTLPVNRKSLLINVLMSIALNWGGCIVVTAYCKLIFEVMKAPISSNISMVITGILQFIPNILTISVVERFGRRPLLRISGIVSGTFLLIVATYFYLLEYTEIDVTPYSIYALCAMFGNLIAVNIGMMPLQIVIQSETLATDIKACALSIITIMGGLLSSISLKAYIFLAVTLNLGHSVPFFGFVIVTWLCTFFILKLLPETRGKTLLDIQNRLRK